MRGFRAFFMGRLCPSKELSWESEVLTQTTEELGSAARQERIEGVYERVREVQRAAGYHGEALERLSERRKRCGRGKRKVVEKEQAIDAIKVEGRSASSSRCLVEGESRWSWMMDGYKLSPCSMSTRNIVDNEFSTRVNVGPNASVTPLAFSGVLSSPFISSEVVL